LVLVAKTQSAFEWMRIEFRARRVKKYYWALVTGVAPTRGSIAYAIAHDRRDKRRMRAVTTPAERGSGEKSWEALTTYKRLSTDGRFSLLEVEMTTGVMHQIRVHLAALGTPIVGDAIYGVKPADTLGLDRHFLHAHRLEFRHPADQRKVAVESPLPPELEKILKRLKMGVKNYRPARRR
jgi:23S rRNA pseudouridine1911/1915/1917 synthase